MERIYKICPEVYVLSWVEKCGLRQEVSEIVPLVRW